MANKRKGNRVKVAVLKMSPYSKQILGWISVTSALIYAFSIWLQIDIGFIPAGLLITGLGAILILEEVFEGDKVLRLGDVIVIGLGILAITLGILTMAQIPLPQFLLDIQGLLYVIVAGAIIYAMYR